MRKTLLVFMVLTLLGCQGAGGETPQEDAMTSNTHDQLETATLAGGCFWCVESDMEQLDGVVEAVSGYAGGHVQQPSYEDVTTGRTGHREAVQVRFDPSVVTYAEILDAFWRHIDPTDPDGSFGDRGFQYSPAVFYHNETQREVAERSRQELQDSGVFTENIAVEILPFTNFYKAEDYHQDYYRTHTTRYKTYRHFSGRDKFLEEHWGRAGKRAGSREESRAGPGPADAPEKQAYSRPDDQTLRSTLTPLQFKVTRQEGTEPPFDNEYWDNKRPGIYVDIVSGEPLFSSANKYQSGTGWPSFDRPLVPENIVEREDRSWFSVRTEVRSRHGDSHLGHVFTDGPPTTGLRYCINSAALRFVPREDMVEQGYADFLTGL